MSSKQPGQSRNESASQQRSRQPEHLPLTPPIAHHGTLSEDLSGRVDHPTRGSRVAAPQPRRYVASGPPVTQPAVRPHTSLGRGNRIPDGEGGYYPPPIQELWNVSSPPASSTGAPPTGYKPERSGARTSNAVVDWGRETVSGYSVGDKYADVGIHATEQMLRAKIMQSKALEDELAATQKRLVAAEAKLAAQEEKLVTAHREYRKHIRVLSERHAQTIRQLQDELKTLKEHLEISGRKRK